MSAPDLDDVVDDLPPSASFVGWLLQECGGSITREAREALLEQTHLNERTLDRAIDRLEELDVVRLDRDGGDLRFVCILFVEASKLL